MSTDSIIKDIELAIGSKAFLSIEEFADLLGIEPKVVYNWTRRAEDSRRLPKITIGRVVRLPKSAVLSWIAEEAKRGRLGAR